MNNEVSRRSIIRGFTVFSGAALLNNIGTAQVAPPIVPGRLRIVEGSWPDLSDKRVLSLFKANDTVYFDETTAPPDFYFEERIDLQNDDIAYFADGENSESSGLYISGQEDRQYLVTKDGQVIGNISVTVNLRRAVRLFLTVRPAFSSSVDQVSRSNWLTILRNIASLVPVDSQSTPIPDFEYEILKQASSLNLDLQSIVFYFGFDLRPAGPVVVVGDPNDPTGGIQQVLRGETEGSCLFEFGSSAVQSNNLAECFSGHTIEYRLLNSSAVTLPNQSVQPPNVVDSDGDNIDVSNKMALSIAEAINCDAKLAEGATHEIMKIGVWPEFKVMIRMVRINIRIRWGFLRWTASFDIPVPYNYKRITTATLVSFVRYPINQIPLAVVEISHQCARSAGMLIGSSGIWLVNPAAALAAFLGAFELCFKLAGLELVRCLIPGLVVIRKTTDWQLV